MKACHDCLQNTLKKLNKLLQQLNFKIKYILNLIQFNFHFINPTSTTSSVSGYSEIFFLASRRGSWGDLTRWYQLHGAKILRRSAVWDPIAPPQF